MSAGNGAAPGPGPLGCANSPAPRARHDPGDNAQVIAQSFARLLPTLQHATQLITKEQRAFLHRIAARKGATLWIAWFVDQAQTEAEGLFLRRVLLAMPDPTPESPEQKP